MSDVLADRVLAGCQRAGVRLPAEIESARDGVARLEALRIEASQRANDKRRDPAWILNSIISEIADKGGEAPDALDRYFDAERERQRDEIERRAYSEALRLLRQRLGGRLGSLGDTITAEYLRPAHDAILKEGRQVLKVLDGLHDAESVLASGDAKQRNAWTKLTDLAGRYGEIRDVFDALRRLMYSNKTRDITGTLAVFKHPTLPSPSLPSDPLERFIRIATSDDEPWLPTVSEQDDALDAEFGEELAATAAGMKRDLSFGADDT